MSSSNKCRRCFNVLNRCQACKGRGMTTWTTCNRCRNTGVVCLQHGGYWQR